MPGPDAHCRVSVAQFKPCINPHDTTDLPRYLPAGLTQYVLNHHTTKSPPFHVTADDVSVPIERLEFDKISSHRSVRGRGGAIAVLYETHWKGLLRPSRESEADLFHARRHILEYWTGAPLQLRQANRVYRHMRVGAAQRDLARGKDARFLPPGCSYVNHHTWARRFRGTNLPVGTYFWDKAQDNLFWLGKNSAHTLTPGQCVVRFLDDPRTVKLALSSARCTTALGAVRGSWCLQVHQGSSLMRGIVRNVDESRGAEIAGSADLNTPP